MLVLTERNSSLSAIYLYLQRIYLDKCRESVQEWREWGESEDEDNGTRHKVSQNIDW